MHLIAIALLVAADHAAAVRELAELVALPNVASDAPNIARNARQLLTSLRRRGLSPRLLEEPGAPPAVYAELLSPAAKRTVVFYAHYDGQPVDASQWNGSPWAPALRDQTGRELRLPRDGEAISGESRLYGRSTSDDKGAIVAMLAALDTLRAEGKQPSVNLKFYFEGEEEAGSPHLRTLLERHRDLLKADAWIFCDGPVHQSRRLQVVHGARGVLAVDLTVYGPTRALHDGHYGNWAPNPAALLAALLTSMRDSEGRVLVQGFADGVRPLTADERSATDAAPKIDAELRRSLGLAHSEAGDALLAERILLPALNVRGISAGHTGALATNSIPTEAHASIDFRLVPDQTVANVKETFERHLGAQGYFVTHSEPDMATRLAQARIVRVAWEPGYPAARVPSDLPFARAVAAVVAQVTKEPIIRLPNMGGSVPLYLIPEILSAPVLIVPIANHDNNQHAANENLRMQNLFDGIAVFAALFSRLGSEWR